MRSKWRSALCRAERGERDFGRPGERDKRRFSERGIDRKSANYMDLRVPGLLPKADRRRASKPREEEEGGPVMGRKARRQRFDLGRSLLLSAWKLEETSVCTHPKIGNEEICWKSLKVVVEVEKERKGEGNRRAWDETGSKEATSLATRTASTPTLLPFCLARCLLLLCLLPLKILLPPRGTVKSIGISLPKSSNREWSPSFSFPFPSLPS